MLSVTERPIDRLRRSKSTSSAQTTATSTSHLRSRTSIDPFITTQQNAEVAAVEAFGRADQAASGRAISSNLRPVRRRNGKQRTEGSYLEDARLGRRRSTKFTKGDGGMMHAATRAPKIESVAAESELSRSASCSFPRQDACVRNLTYTAGSPAPRHLQLEHCPTRTSTFQLHRPNVGLSDSPVGRSAESVDLHDTVQDTEVASGSLKRAPISPNQIDEGSLALARDRCLQDFQTKKVRERRSFLLGSLTKLRTVTTIGDVSANGKLPSPLTESMPAEPAIRPAPPDSSTEIDPRPRKLSVTLRGRLKKVFRVTSKSVTPSLQIPPQHVPAKDFRWTVKDYDMADESTMIYDASLDPHTHRQARGQTDSPTEHALYHNTIDHSNDDTQISTKGSRFTSWTNSTIVGTSTLRSTDLASESCIERRQDSHSPMPEGDSEPAHRIRKVSSFFGRPVRHKLHRSSKAELSETSNHSRSLFDALQKRIRPAKGTELQPSPVEQTPDPEIPPPPKFTRDMLPSQQRGGGTPTSIGTWRLTYDNASSASVRHARFSTIRAITPNAPADTVQAAEVFLPIVEAASPDDHNHESLSFMKPSNGRATPTESRLHRRSALRAPAPTPAQVAQRVERAKNRWQGPLDSIPLAEPRSTGGTMAGTQADENPYALSGIRSALSPWHSPGIRVAADDALDYMTGLPYSVRVSPKRIADYDDPGHDMDKEDRTPSPLVYPKPSYAPVTPVARSKVKDDPRGDTDRHTGMLSPSVYSRATDGASYHVPSPLDADRDENDGEDAVPDHAEEGAIDDATPSGTLITITGHDIKHYHIPTADETPTAPPATRSGKLRIAKKASVNADGGIDAVKPSWEWRRWLSGEMGVFRQTFGAGAGSRKESGPHAHTHRRSPSSQSIEGRAAAGVGQELPGRDTGQLIRPTIGSSETRHSSASHQLSSTSSRPRTESRASSRSYMNERYPMVQFGAQGNHSPAEDLRPSSAALVARKMASFSHPPRGLSPSDEGEEIVTDNRSQADIGVMGSNKRDSGVHLEPVIVGGQSTTLNRSDYEQNVPSKSVNDNESLQSSSNFRPRSAYELRAKYKVGTRDVSRPLEIRRRHRLTASRPKQASVKESHSSEMTRQTIKFGNPLMDSSSSFGENRDPIERSRHDEDCKADSRDRHTEVTSMKPLVFEEDATLLHISAGPYASAATDATSSLNTPVHERMEERRTEDCYDENMALTSSSALGRTKLGSLSSAEWLTSGTSAHCWQTSTDSADHLPTAQIRSSPAAASRSIARKPVSASKENLQQRDSTHAHTPRRSPGQRLATNWLDGRRDGVIFELENGRGRLRELGSGSRDHKGSEKDGTPAFV